MSTWLSAVVLVAGLAAAAPADYVAQRKAALALAKAGMHADALTAFTAMLEIAESDVQRSDALQQAALCAVNLKQLDLAMQLAEQIPLAPHSKTCQMHVLSSGGKSLEIVERFQAEDIARWPESIRGDAYFVRGQAFFAAKNGAAAVRDLKQAAEYLTDHNSKGLCLNHLGDTYWTLLNDGPRAIDAYRQTYRTGTIYKHCQAAIGVANVFKRQGDHEAAIQELAKIDLDQVTVPYWRGAMLSAMGHALADAGNKADAIARFEQALQLKDLPNSMRLDCEKALGELLAEAK